MSQWHNVSNQDARRNEQTNEQARANNSNEQTAPEKPILESKARSDEETQTQTESLQQPPVKQDQGNRSQPQARGGTSQPAQQEDIPIPDAAKLGPLSEAVYVPMPTGGLRALAIMLWPDDRDNPDLYNQHVADLLMMNRDVVREEYSHPVGATVRIK